VPVVATMVDVERVIAALPGVTQGERWDRRTWDVGGKTFAWERPFSKADIKRFGTETPPDGPIVAVAVVDLEEKDALLLTHPKGIFTIPHFNGYPAVLVHLRTVPLKVLREVIEDAWRSRAPQALAEEHEAGRRGRTGRRRAPRR
jgi:hypothetical protein